MALKLIEADKNGTSLTCLLQGRNDVMFGEGHSLTPTMQQPVSKANNVDIVTIKCIFTFQGGRFLLLVLLKNIECNIVVL